MNKNLHLFLLTVILIFTFALQSNAQEYKLQRWVIGSGGSVMLLNPSDSTYLSGMIGQTAITIGNQGTSFLHHGFWVTADTILGVDDNPVTLSKDLINYPNPFSSFTTIKYIIPNTGKVTIRIYDMVGRLRKTLVSEIQGGGQQEVTWDGKDDEGFDCASGSYVYELNVRPAQLAGPSNYRDINLRNVMVIVR